MTYRDNLHDPDPFPSRLASVAPARRVAVMYGWGIFAGGVGCLSIGATSILPLGVTQRLETLAFLLLGIAALAWAVWLRRKTLAFVTDGGGNVGVYRRGLFVEKTSRPQVSPVFTPLLDTLRLYFATGLGTLVSGFLLWLAIDVKDTGGALVTGGFFLGCAGVLASQTWLRVVGAQVRVHLELGETDDLWIRRRDLARLRAA